tara:strand:+ start:631 stop:1257 length:627 start_codon:yes stop_codon:yes gene_type:complete
MSQNDSDVKDIHKCRTNLLKQLNLLGYNTENYESFGINEVNTMYNKNQLDMFIENDENGKKIWVKFHLGKTLRQSNINEIIDDLINIEKTLEKTDTIIIIIKDAPNDTINSILKFIWDNYGIFVSVRSIKSLLFNIFEHSYVPLHIILSNEEVQEFKAKYNITRDDMIPEISRFDPVAAALLMKPGQICKIVRSSKTAISADFYRICI